MADLGEFLRDGTRRPRQAGEWDCCAFPAAWAVQLCGFDPMAAWRGMYTTDQEGEQIAADAGGLVPLFSRGFGSIGWQDVPAGEWKAGDVAVISVLGQQAGAVFVGPRWSFVATRGLAFASLDIECVLRAWGWRG